MTDIAIPDWTPQGILPPVHVPDMTSANRSPYRVSLIDLVLRFGTTPCRRTLLSGFLTFRAGLHKAGLKEGFQ